MVLKLITCFTCVSFYIMFRTLALGTLCLGNNTAFSASCNFYDTFSKSAIIKYHEKYDCLDSFRYQTRAAKSCNDDW